MLRTIMGPGEASIRYTDDRPALCIDHGDEVVSWSTNLVKVSSEDSDCRRSLDQLE